MPAQRFRKRPVVVEALLFDGTNVAELAEWTGGRFRAADRGEGIVAEVHDVLHDTWVGVKAGQWVLRGTAGEHYPCAAEVFEDLYEPA